MKIKAEKKNMRLDFMGKRIPRSFPQNQPVDPVLINLMPTTELISIAYGRHGLPRFASKDQEAVMARTELRKRLVIQ